MNGTKVVIDSNVVILGSKGIIDFEFVNRTYNEFFVSIITYLEALSFDFDGSAEEAFIEDFFGSVQIVDVDKTISEEIIAIRKQKRKKIKLPDSIILATAKHLAADLLTNNVSDFSGIDPSITVRGIEEFRADSPHELPG